MLGCNIMPFRFLTFILCFHHIYGVPVPKGFEEIHVVTTYLPSYTTVLISLGALLLIVYFVFGCVCCPNKSIKALSYQNGFPVSRLNENTFENPTEITIFPPHSTVIDLQPVSPTFPAFDDKVTFEPLPDILPKKFTTGQSAACSSRPAHFSALLKSKVSLHDWFDDPNSNFPREQLQYLQEIGCGWFGCIVEGEAAQICYKEEKTAVIVKILREEASPSEHLHFLHEVRPYRDLKHPNVIQLLGRCLESDPFLLIMEHSICDLKSYLIKQDNRDSLMNDGLMLQMISNIASGVHYMHDKGFCHMDLAAHNCFVCKDNIIKIGDYGVSFDRWKDDYYCLGDIALPIRWYSPEILHCSETTIETKEISKEANVWAFGVVLWEIVQFGKLPYEGLNDEEVLQKVLIEKSVQLDSFTAEIPYKDEISLVMRECWKPKKYRPAMEKIESFITQFCSDKLSTKTKELTFEERWNSIQPRITEISSYTGTESSSFKFENDFSTRSDLQNYSSDNEILSSFEMSFDILPKTEFSAQLSPSLNVLNGSIDELTENDVYLNSISLSCGKNDADTLSNISDKENLQMEEDKDNFQTKNIISEQISAAIRDLDLVLVNQPDSSKNTVHITTNLVSNDLEVVDYYKEVNANGMSDALYNSENSHSKCPNVPEYIDSIRNGRCEDLDANSDLNGNCSFHNSHINYSQKEITSNAMCEGKEHQNCNSIVFVQQNISSKDSESIQERLCSDICNKYQDVQTAISDYKQFSPVPDIIIHESPLINTNENVDEHTECETNNDYGKQETKKIFRFVFKDCPNQDLTEISHQEFRKELDHDITQSFMKTGRSKPLTSTPVRNKSDSFSHITDSYSMNKNCTSNDVFYNTVSRFPEEDSFVGKETENISETNHITNCNEVLSDDSSYKSDVNFNTQSESTANSTGLDHFTTAQSSLGLSNDDDSANKFSDQNISNERTFVFQTNRNDVTLSSNDRCQKVNNVLIESNSNSNNVHISTEHDILTKNNIAKNLTDIISPPNGYISSNKTDIVIHFTDADNDTENEYFENSKVSETVSPPQAFQDNGLTASNDSFSESKTSFDQDFSTSAECGSSENLEHYLEDDHVAQENKSTAKLLETSFPEVASQSFTYETYANSSGNMRPKKNGTSLSSTDSDKKMHSIYQPECVRNGYQNNDHYENHKPHFQPYDQMIVEDLDTGEQTVINESYSVCDDYENSGESDEILKINTETDEAIIVDSSEALIGFVPSRSIELLQEFEVIPPISPSYAIDEEKESSDSTNIDICNSTSPSPAGLKHNSSPYESPESTCPQQPYRSFCLQNEVIEEEITDEIASPSSFHSSSSYCSNEIFLDEEKMSQSSESPHHEEMYETSVLPSVDHLYISDDGSKTDISISECSPVKKKNIMNAKYQTDEDNNHISDDQEDVMHSYQPTQSIRWFSDDTLDVERDSQSPIIIEGREILAGDIMQTCELTAEDIANALTQLEAKNRNHGLNPNRLSISPSPYSSIESSPCRDTLYTPDFESDTEETNSGTSCSSTSGSFECIHNKFKNAVDISKVMDESEKSVSSREHSPMKIFSRTWDCHATPTKGVLVTPEKKFNSMRKSVSFHEEDPQVVFEYPPASDSSEDDYSSDDNHQEFCHNIDYMKYADWDLQVGDVEDIEAKEVVEIEELDYEPYVRRPVRSTVGPLNRPMLYTLTSGFSDEDFDSLEAIPPSSCQAPSNSPDEKELAPISNSFINEFIQNHLDNLSERNEKTTTTETATLIQQDVEVMSAPMLSVQESVVSSVVVEDIVIDKLLPERLVISQHEAVQLEDQNKYYSDINDTEEEIIVEELRDDSECESADFKEWEKQSKQETDLISYLDTESTVKEQLNHVNETVESEEYSVKINNTGDSAIILSSNIVSPKYSVELSYVSDKVEHPEKTSSKDIGLDSLAFSNSIKCESIENASISKNALNEILENKSLAEIIPESSFTESKKDIASVNESTSQENILINLNVIDSGTILNLIDNNITESEENRTHKSNACPYNKNDNQIYKSVIPVQSFPFESDCDEKTCAIDISNKVKCVSNKECESMLKECNTEITAFDVLNISAQTNLINDNGSKSNYSKSCSNVDSKIKTTDSVCSTDLILSINENKIDKPSEFLNKVDLLDAIPESNAEFILNSEGNSNKSSEYVNTSENNHISSTNSLFGSKNTSQGTIQLKDSSGDVLYNSKEISSHVSVKSTVPDKIQITEENKHANSVFSADLHLTFTDECFDKKDTMSATNNQDENMKLLNVPKIIVTPASGSEGEVENEDELDEYLREQLEHFHSEVSPPQEDFSVTSEFSSKPFDDVFGSYVSGDSTEYIEAFNFEFENGNLFEDFVDDYPLDLQTGMNEKLCVIDGRQKRSTSLPLMTENLSDDDSLIIKSDSSLLYDSTKNITRL